MDDKYYAENRIKQALELRGMKQIELCEKTGIKKSSVNGWIKQNWQPKQNALYLMARALNVSEMWLAGFDVPMERSEWQQRNDEVAYLIEAINSDTHVRDLHVNISKLNQEQLGTIESIVNQFLKANMGE